MSDIHPQGEGQECRSPMLGASAAGLPSGPPYVVNSVGPVQPTYLAGEWAVGTPPGKYYVGVSDAGHTKVVGSFLVPVGMAGRFVVQAFLPSGRFNIVADRSLGSIAVYSGKYLQSGPDDGWSIAEPDEELTRKLFVMSSP